MGQYLVSVPDIGDSELVFDEAKTRQIFAFFYPASRSSVSAMSINNEARRLAQTMLIAALDGSYAMSYIQTLVESLRPTPGMSVRSLLKKLVNKGIRIWFQHATGHDLENPRIYESVRVAIANALLPRFTEAIQGILAKQGRFVRAFLADSTLRGDIAWI